MARRYYSSVAQRTTLASDLDNSSATVVVAAVSGFPSSFPYTLIIDQDTVNEEIVTVTARSGTTLTVTRGVDGTSGVAHSTGAIVNHGVSARDFDEPNAFINGTGVVTETMLAADSVVSGKIADGTIVNADVSASAAIAQSKIADLTTDLAAKIAYPSGGSDGNVLVKSGTAAAWGTASPHANSATQEVLTTQSTASTTYTDLATAGPAVTVTTGTKALVIVTAEFYNTSTDAASRVSFAVSGASTVSAADKWSIKAGLPNSNHSIAASTAYLLTGLTAGSNTFTVKYRVVAGTGYFNNRSIVVVDMGS